MGVWDMDIATNMTWHSPTHARIYGYEVLPQWSYGKFLEHVHPDDWPVVNEPFQRGIARNESCGALNAVSDAWMDRSGGLRSSPTLKWTRQGKSPA